MKKIISLLMIFFAFSKACICQTDAELIMMKIEPYEGFSDEDYLWNLKYTTEFSGKYLKTQSINLRDAADKYDIFKDDEPRLGIKYTYVIYYYHEDCDLNGKITPLAIKELTKKGSVTESRYVFRLDDFKKLSLSSKSNVISSLIALIKEKGSGATVTYKHNNKGNQLSSPVNIRDRSEIYKGIAEVIKPYRYSPPPEDYPSGFSFPGLNLSCSPEWLADINFIGIENIGIEFGFSKDNILNLLEYQNPVVSAGPFFYFDFGKTPLVIDFKFLLQLRQDHRKLLNTKSWPIFDFDSVQINKASGFTYETHISGSIGDFKLPFINVCGSHGRKENFKNPVFRRYISSETQQSYYSLNQMEISTSFFWNAGNINNHNKFRVDIGIGSYDMWKVLYNSNNTIVSSKKINKFLKWLPLLAFEYVHSSDKTRLGISTRYFDNRIGFGAWLKLYKEDPFEIRIEENYISASFSKVIEDWDHKGSSNMMQLVFRYGLN